jgi:hypothetical protein
MFKPQKIKEKLKKYEVYNNLLQVQGGNSAICIKLMTQLPVEME